MALFGLVAMLTQDVIVLGTIVGAILVEYASWRWIFWLIAIIAVPIAILCVVLIPQTPRNEENKKSTFDFVGVFLLTGEHFYTRFCVYSNAWMPVSVILFVYALTSGSVQSWKSAGVLAPLFVSVALAAGFFIWETRIDEDSAAL